MKYSQEDYKRLVHIRDDVEGGPVSFLAGMMLQTINHIEAEEDYDAEMNRIGDY